MTVRPHRPRAEILLQLGFPDNPVIALIGAPDLILGLPVAGGGPVDNPGAAPPSIAGCMILSLADGLSYGAAVRSQDELLHERPSKSIALFVTVTSRARWRGPGRLRLR